MAEIPATMRAVAIDNPGKAGVLVSTTVATPEPAAQEVLVRVEAAGVNRPDCLQRRGLYPVPADASPLPGLEIAGRVVALGPDVTRLRIGDAVMALTHGGGYAAYCPVDESHCLPIPEGLDRIEAAAIPETFFTVWYNVFMRCRLVAGEILLVHGGSSGIGTTAIQLGKAFDCRVVTTARSDEKCRFCERLGADLAINYKDEDWAARTREFADPRGVDVVLDMVAGSYAQRNLDLLGRDGRYALIAFLGGSVAELDLSPVLRKRLTITGSTLRPQTVAEKAAIAAELAENVLPLIAAGTVKPVIATTFALEEAQAAHELMESSRHMGKIVLRVADGSPR